MSLLCYSTSAWCHLLSAANCSDPIAPGNGVIEPFQNTLEGAEIFFRCNPGFVPAGRMRALCASDGRWNPDLVCICKITKASRGWVKGRLDTTFSQHPKQFLSTYCVLQCMSFHCFIESSKSLMIQLRGLILSVITSFSHSHYGSTPDCNIRSLELFKCMIC